MYWTHPDVFEVEVQVTAVGPAQVTTDPIIPCDPAISTFIALFLSSISEQESHGSIGLSLRCLLALRCAPER